MSDFVAVPKLERSGGWVIETPVGTVSPDFQDDFETGDLTHTENGAGWVSGEYTNASGSGVHVVNSADGHPVNSGQHAMQFEYVFPGTAEERFTLGADYDHVWMEWQHYWTDWDYPDTDSLDNDKFFALWGGANSQYNDGGSPGMVWETVPANSISSNGNRDVDLRLSYFDGGGRINFETPGGWQPFIRDEGPGLRGQYNRIRVEAAVATSSAADDGIYRVWVNGTQILDWTGAPFWVDEETETGPNAFTRGYLMGSLDTDPEQGITYYIDDVECYFSDPGDTMRHLTTLAPLALLVGCGGATYAH